MTVNTTPPAPMPPAPTSAPTAPVPSPAAAPRPRAPRTTRMVTIKNVELPFWPIVEGIGLGVVGIVFMCGDVFGWWWTLAGFVALLVLGVAVWEVVYRLRRRGQNRRGGTPGTRRSPLAAVRSRIPVRLGGTRTPGTRSRTGTAGTGTTGTRSGLLARLTPGARGRAARAAGTGTGRTGTSPGGTAAGGRAPVARGASGGGSRQWPWGRGSRRSGGGSMTLTKPPDPRRAPGSKPSPKPTPGAAVKPPTGPGPKPPTNTGPAVKPATGTGPAAAPTAQRPPQAPASKQQPAAKPQQIKTPAATAPPKHHGGGNNVAVFNPAGLGLHATGALLKRLPEQSNEHLDSLINVMSHVDGGLGALPATPLREQAAAARNHLRAAKAILAEMGGTYERNHDHDEARLREPRGGIAAEVQADVGKAVRDGE